VADARRSLLCGSMCAWFIARLDVRLVYRAAVIAD
jgi:hypothetical protein